MKKPRILVVEDEWIVAKNIQGYLETFGYTVTSIASSGDKAVKKTQEDKPDLVLMDIVLPGEIDGIEAAKQIRTCLNIPIIYLTAHVDKEKLERAKVTEPYGYIVKPIEERELYCAIEVALYKDKMENALERQREKFLSVLIHDLKGPLVPIIGFTKRLIEGKARSEEDRLATLNMILESAENLLEVIKGTSHSLKNRASLQSLNLEQVEFSEIILTVIMNNMAEMEKRGIRVFINEKNERQWDNLEKVFLKADPFQLKTLVENLIGNAIKYAKGIIKIELHKSHSKIRFVVSDDGPGIAESYHNKIFEEYFQVPGSQIGTGIGLYSVKKVVENHRGRIVVHSSLNKGASFEIKLPS